MKKNLLTLTLLVVALLGFVSPVHAQAEPVTGRFAHIYLPIGRSDRALASFVSEVSSSGNANRLVGVYQYNNILAPVVQQPSGQAGYVSTESGKVTQFAAAGQYGVTALLAHNYLEGQTFFSIKEGNKIVLVFGDGHTEDYRVTQVKQYQALSPTSPYSKFIDLADPSQTVLTSTDLFYDIYAVQGRLVLQTCIEKDGQSSWGRLFVIAEKIGSSNLLAMN
jgi:hypothetical protein